MLQSLDHKPDIIAITEVKPKFFKNKLFSSEFYLEGYNMFVNKQLNASLLPLPYDFQEHGFVEIQGKCSDQNMIVGNVYRSPNSSCDNDLKLRYYKLNM